MFPPVAVVGQACVLPGALRPDELWSAVLAGRDLLGTVPPDRWRIDPARIIGDSEVDCAWSDRGGYVTGFESIFDPAGFAIPTERLLALDPLFHWVLHTGREALREAGHDGRSGASRIGAVVGNLSFPSSGLSAWAEHVWLADRFPGLPRPDPHNRFMSGLPAHLLAEALGLGAGAFALDAACASSLYALKLACDRLHDGRADLMLAGAACRADDLFIHVGFSALRALSRSGQSRPFHRDADGLVPAEGAAILALKRLDDAVSAGDRILAVIRGIGLANDGRGAGLLAPAEEGQVRAMRAAYASAGISPRDITLLECHATGTPVGDATEVRSTAQIFAGAADVPVGSVKSNLGHLVTTAGAAGLLKVIAALRERVRPPTRHADAPIDALAGSPFRLLQTAEPWPSTGARRAAVSAFGFGGNNAHVLVEEWTGEPDRRRTRTATRPRTVVRPRREDVAVVGVGTVVADCPDTAAVARALFAGDQRVRPRADGMLAAFTESVALDPVRLRFPPRDLEQALGQQLLVLRAAGEAIGDTRLSRDRTAVLVGMQCDVEVARYGARWRLPAWSGTAEADRDGVSRPLATAGVLGSMPNLVANRLNSAFDLAGPSFTVSAEELSGLVALDLAAGALRAGEIDAAVVGAVDACADPAHAAAARAVLGPERGPPGDAAIVLVLKRLSDARRDGDRVHAVLPAEPATGTGLRLGLAESHTSLTPLFGHAHAASGLLHAAAAVLACHHAARPSGVPGAPARPWLPGPEGTVASVSATALGGGSTSLCVATDPAGAPAPLWLGPVPRLHVFSGADRTELQRRLAAGVESRDGPARLVLVAASAEELAARRARARAFLESGAPYGHGVFFRERPIGGDLAFVFAPPAGAYRGMGRDLLLARPDLVASFSQRFGRLRQAAGWVFEDGPDPAPAEQLWGSSLLCQLHAALTRTVLGLSPQAALGISAGETNALFAFDAWSDMDDLYGSIEEERVYDRELAGEFAAVRRAWGTTGPVDWASWRVLAPLDAVRAALRTEPRTHLTIVNAPGDCVIAGDASACRRVVARLAPHHAHPLGYDIAVHCPELGEFREAWQRIHRRPTADVPGVRFYTHATCEPYRPTADSVADAMLGQALRTVDFPRLVERSWADGVRVFLEHGPGGACSRWISHILGDREHVAVPLDLPGGSSLRSAVNAVAAMVAAGLDVDDGRLLNRLEPPRPAAPRRRLTLPVHQPPIAPPLLRPPPEAVMPPAPPLPPVLEAEPTPAEPIAAGLLSGLVAAHAQLAALHREFLTQHADIHRRFLAVRANPPPPPAGGLGLSLSRAQLEAFASGPVSAVLGGRFAELDTYRRVVRLPAPPLLLADRVLAIRGEAGSLGVGTIWTETDVQPDSWYLQDGHMPAGVMIEAGQADLLLISWLGVDFRNRGDRVYRLLGCELTYHGGLPQAGDTLQYDIHVDGHAEQDGVRLFFFHSDCHIGGVPGLSVRSGQAGFFTDKGLATTGGVLWDAATAPPPAGAPPDPPAVPAVPRRLDRRALRAFAEGRVREAYGPGFERAESHVRTPRIAGDRMLLLHEVDHLDPAGGPWRRGYLQARWRFSPDDWFFAGHFKDDPCMPGTLMFEGGLQAMSVYLTALGYTLERDGWRFEPVPEEAFPLACRGQATPGSRELVYELFVEEVTAGPVPTLHADVLCTVDGVKAFHGRRIGLRLVPDWPIPGRATTGRRAGGTTGGSLSVRFDEEGILACALGRPSDAFGPAYRALDGPLQMPRLPGPPYLFLSRVTSVAGELGTRRAGTVVETEYDVPADAWYFTEDGYSTMPYCVLLEALLQPCGWLALASGIPLATDQALHFRNLDGTGRVVREVRPGDGPLRTRVRLTDISESGDIWLTSFQVSAWVGDQELFTVDTGFGFFPGTTLAAQVGLPTTDQDAYWFSRPTHAPLALAGTALPGPRLRMLDRVTGWWPDGGRAGLGRLRAEKDVDPADWYFKAHFYQDPVQPGSLGLAAMLQLLRIYMDAHGLAAGVERPRFQPIALGETVTWKYRGQVLPTHRQVTVELEMTEAGTDELGAFARADGWLWVDGTRIYEARNLAMRIVPCG